MLKRYTIVNPVLLVTARKNKENKCIIEIMNRILIRDINAKIEEVVKNVFLVYSSLSPMETYGLLFSARPSCIAKVYPIHFMIPSTQEEEIIRKTIENAKKIVKTSFYVDCHKRGIEVNCRQIEIGIGLGLKGYAKVDFKKPDFVVVINVIPNLATVSYVKNTFG
ncbi:THUMP domain-containing protein [Stygiolobus sp. CP850M]|uniref:THUMP domain-containing protein n=1 Tax=Stygiolobus sp. CP850M TaxID=3133134 RepID=UPI00307F62CF